MRNSEDCFHDDTDRVGPYKIVCFGCKHVADIRDLPNVVWKPMSEAFEEE